MIDKGWVVEDDEKITIYWSKPADLKCYEAVIKIIPVERDVLQDAIDDATKAVSDFDTEMYRMKEAAKSIVREINKRRRS